MDFIKWLDQTRRQHDSIWVIADRMTNSSRILAVKTIDSVEYYANVYIYEFFRFYGVTLSTISYRGHRFTDHFLRLFHKGRGT